MLERELLVRGAIRTRIKVTLKIITINISTLNRKEDKGNWMKYL